MSLIREQLEDVLPGGDGPVHQFFEVMELADAEAFLRPEGEDRHGRARAPPGEGLEGRDEVVHDQMRALGGHFGEEVVWPFLPADDPSVFHEDELEFEGIPDIQRDAPPGEAAVIQQDGLRPVGVGDDRGPEAGPYLGRRDDERDVPAAGQRFLRVRAEGTAFAAAEDDIAEGGGPEGGIRGAVRPAVADRDRSGALRREEAPAAPLAADDLVLPDDEVAVFRARAELPSGQDGLPDPAGLVSHVVKFLPGAEFDLLAPDGMVTQVQFDGHGVGIKSDAKDTSFVRDSIASRDGNRHFP